jgi:hypothetical protein
VAWYLPATNGWRVVQGVPGWLASWLQPGPTCAAIHAQDLVEVALSAHHQAAAQRAAALLPPPRRRCATLGVAAAKAAGGQGRAAAANGPAGGGTLWQQWGAMRSRTGWRGSRRLAALPGGGSPPEAVRPAQAAAPPPIGKCSGSESSPPSLHSPKGPLRPAGRASRVSGSDHTRTLRLGGQCTGRCLHVEGLGEGWRSPWTEVATGPGGVGGAAAGGGAAGLRRSEFA